MPIYDTVKLGRKNQGVEKDKPRLKKIFLEFFKKMRGMYHYLLHTGGYNKSRFFKEVLSQTKSALWSKWV